MLFVIWGLFADNFDILPERLCKILNNLNNSIFNSQTKYNFSMIKYQISNFHNHSFRNFTTKTNLNTMSFILICYFGTIDVDFESIVFIDVKGYHYNEITVLLDEGADACIVAVFPIKRQQTIPQPNHKPITLIHPTILHIPQLNRSQF